MSTIVWIWIITGGILMILEFFIPGLFSVFLGLAAVITGILIHFNLVTNIIQALIVWMAMSMFFLLTIRQVAARFFLSDEEYRYKEEDDEAVGQIVQVTHAANDKDSNGRIRYQGTEWPARSLKGTIEKGSFAIIQYRDNISWVIKEKKNGDET